jgi:hypothetical protein
VRPNLPVPLELLEKILQKTRAAWDDDLNSVVRVNRIIDVSEEAKLGLSELSIFL